MTQPLSGDDLEQANLILDDLLEAVTREEGTLAGGEKLGRGGEALTGLRETEVTFGNPKDNLTQLTPALFDTLGLTLNPLQRKQMEETFDFYYMTLTVSLHPRRGAQFQLVECQVAFGPDEVPIIQTIFPQSRWRTVLEWGGGMSLGLNADLEWEAGLPGDKVQELSGVSGVPSANLKTQNEMKSHIVVPDYSFDMGRAEISATGEGNAAATWRLQQPELKESHTVRFIIVFKVPKGMEQVELVGKALAEPQISWLTGQLRDVFGELSERFRNLLRRNDDERSGAERLPIGAHEKWVLTLPRQADAPS
jgi:hypothetical protein